MSSVPIRWSGEKRSQIKSKIPRGRGSLLQSASALIRTNGAGMGRSNSATGAPMGVSDLRGPILVRSVASIKAFIDARIIEAAPNLLTKAISYNTENSFVDTET